MRCARDPGASFGGAGGDSPRRELPRSRGPGRRGDCGSRRGAAWRATQGHHPAGAALPGPP
eukprot:9488199-Pyramimonas_sp.AAC.1